MINKLFSKIFLLNFLIHGPLPLLQCHFPPMFPFKYGQFLQNKYFLLQMRFRDYRNVLPYPTYKVPKKVSLRQGHISSHKGFATMHDWQPNDAFFQIIDKSMRRHQSPILVSDTSRYYPHILFLNFSLAQAACMRHVCLPTFALSSFFLFLRLLLLTHFQESPVRENLFPPIFWHN